MNIHENGATLFASSILLLRNVSVCRVLLYLWLCYWPVLYSFCLSGYGIYIRQPQVWP